MKILITLIGFSSFLLLVAFQKQQPSSQALKKGKELSKLCVNCHGTTKGVAADPLQRIRTVRTADWIYRSIQNPPKFMSENKQAESVFKKRGYNMPSFPTLSKTDINAILDYLDSLPFDSNNYKHRK